MLNSYIWKLYLDSGGKETVDIFSRNLSGTIEQEYINKIKELQKNYVVCEWLINDTSDMLADVVRYQKDYISEESEHDEAEEIDNIVLTDNEVHSFIDDAFSNFIEGVFDETNKVSDVDYKILLNEYLGYDIGYYSTLLNYIFPYDVFVPYYFFANHNVLERIAEVFEMKMPEIPKKSDYKGRCWYYTELCKCFYSFRMKNNLTFPEFCAFLYDFAPKYIGGTDSYIVKDIPEPKSAYFIGGGGDSLDAIAEDNPNSIFYWQCNPNTKVGDVIVMYLRTPISSISSIWRAYSVGFIDPFFWYYRMTYIGNPQKIKRISFSEIKADCILGNMPLTKKICRGLMV